MSDLEWNKYVEKLARSIKMPGDIEIIKSNLSGFKWKSVAKKRVYKAKTEKKNEIKVKNEYIVPKVEYTMKLYMYKGKILRYNKIK